MIGLPDALDIDRFRSAITRRLGLQFDEAKTGFLGDVLLRRMEKLGESSHAYLAALEAAPAADELALLAEELTVNETYFFRNNEQFRALAEIVLPERMTLGPTPRTLRILSAGCASGEEPYTIAILLRQSLATIAGGITIQAVDLDPSVLAKARNGRYSAWSLRETPPEIRERWFRADGRDLVLDETVKGAVRFERRNLAAEELELWPPATYDVVFCRNVIMYFSPAQQQALVARIVSALAPGGYLFLGHAETLRGLSDDFHLRHTHGTFYYQLKGADETELAWPGMSMPRAIPAGPPPPPITLSDAWVDAIREASERVGLLVAGEAARVAPGAPARSIWDMATALDLLRQERFTDALAYVRDHPAYADPDPDMLLLEAMLLAHNGEIVPAQRACERLFVRDELNAGAHYILALCLENLGDRAGAAEHDRVAVYLDPGFAMPRLHLGLLSRRAGDLATGRRELAQALILLAREDASRLLLFGGGFHRDALIALCSSALSDCGGRP